MEGPETVFHLMKFVVDSEGIYFCGLAHVLVQDMLKTLRLEKLMIQEVKYREVNGT